MNPLRAIGWCLEASLAPLDEVAEGMTARWWSKEQAKREVARKARETPEYLESLRRFKEAEYDFLMAQGPTFLEEEE